MPGIFDIKDSCTGCGACSCICPHDCIRLEPDSEGFFYPVYNDADCIECGLCEKACHALSAQEREPLSKERYFLYRSLDDEILKGSSSGGGFTLFAEWVLNEGGVVFGSCYNADENRLEVFSTEKIAFQSLRKSKYIESYTGKVYSEVRKSLKEKRRVLFCGTPCQVRGLKRFLTVSNTDSSLLLTMDFICHGVPSNLIFNLFSERFKKRGKVVDVDFRYKDFSKKHLMWHNMALKMLFSAGKNIIIQRGDRQYYYYYQLFLDNLILRRSCYTCDIANHSDADITMGDFWGIFRYRTELDDNKGMSFLRINNKGVLPLWEELSKNGFSEALPYPYVAYIHNDTRELRLKQLQERNKFMSDVISLGYNAAVRKRYPLGTIVKKYIADRVWKRAKSYVANTRFGRILK